MERELERRVELCVYYVCDIPSRIPRAGFYRLGRMDDVIFVK